MARLFLIISGLLTAVLAIAGIFWPPVLWAFAGAGPVIVIGLWDLTQTHHGIRRNYPVIGNLRYFFEFIRPELQQYFVESNQSGRPIPRELRSVVYQRAKGALQSLPFGTQQDVYSEGYEWVNHSIMPKKVEPTELRVMIGGPQCQQPYLASLFNISGMSYGALSHAAVTALNLGAQKGGFFHNTGEGGLTPYHLHGGDVVWNIGTGYFSCRTPDGKFSREKFKQKAILPNVKMIELKLSQGAKPGKGGLLPAAKVTEEIAKIRGVNFGEDVISPSAHTAFTTPLEMMHFIADLRSLSGGKPVGFKLCVGKKHEFIAICKAMLKSGIYPDFITVDGAEGGTGAAPLEFANSVGMPLEEGLSFVHDVLVGFNIRKHIRVLAAGKVVSGFNMITRMALGADALNSARGMMLALGCIHALKCNTNRCPAGITTNDPGLVRGLYVPDKKERVARYHEETIHAFAEILSAMGYQNPRQIRREDIYRRLSDGVVKTYAELFPSMEPGAFLDEGKIHRLPSGLKAAFAAANADDFRPHFQASEGKVLAAY